MKIETVALILEPTVLIILSFLKTKEVEKRTVKKLVDGKLKEEVVEIQPSTYGTLAAAELT